LERIMIVILGLIILLAAVIIGVAGVLSNGGHAHALPHEFAVLGYHVTGSTGTLFLVGIVVGAAAMAGLCLLLASARRTSRRGSAARRGLKQSRQETAAVSQDRDDLIDQREAARAYTAGNPGNGSARSDPEPDPDDSREQRLRPFWRRLTPRQRTEEPRQPPDSPSGSAEPVDAPAAPAQQLTNGSSP
jgi:uncharacterized membrane protein YciS (DUF1049 family)